MKQALGILLVLAGTVLLAGAALVWFVPTLTSTVPPKTAVDSGRLEDLPPGLNRAVPTPVPERPIVYRLPSVISSALRELTAAAEPPMLLPESPLAEEITAVVEEASPALETIAPAQPLRIIIPALDIDAPVTPVGLEARQSGRREFSQWTVPNAYAAGWHNTSAVVGEQGNLVLNGHNNIHGALFGELATLAIGEQIVLLGKESAQVYRVTQSELIEENDLTLRDRLQNARWIEPTEDERLTLVTCWPKATNSHRLIVVAKPLGEEG